MTASLFPLIVYIIPLCMLLFICSPLRFRPFVLGFSGVIYTIWAGGWLAASFLLLQVCIGWLGMRMLSEIHSSTYSKIGLVGSIVLELLLLIPAKLLFRRIALIPFVVIAMNCIDTFLAQKEEKDSIPSLFTFFCSVCSFPRLVLGPIHTHAEAQAFFQNYHTSLRKFCAGVQKYIYGLFEIVLLGLPMHSFYREMREVSTSMTALDGWLILVVLFLMVYMVFHGAALITLGIAYMLDTEDIVYEEGMEINPTIGNILQQYFPNLTKWSKQALSIHSGRKTSAYCATLLPLLCLIGALFGSGVCGIFWGGFIALVLTAEHSKQAKESKQTSSPMHWLSKALLLVLPLGLLAFSSISECFSVYAALFCKNGFLPSHSIFYLCKVHWLPFFICLWSVFPFKNMLSVWMKRHSSICAIRKMLSPLFHAAAFLLCIVSIMSMYLRS